MDSYVRTGKLLESVPIQCNKAGQEVTPGVIVHFHNQPIKFLLDRVLELWLSCRGICISDLTRNDMEKMVALLLRHEVDALPKFVLRGGGAYVAVSTLEFDNEESVDWKKKDEALAEIRSEKCVCVDDEQFIAHAFSATHNAKRLRALKHLKGGSFDLIDIKVSSNLKSKLKPGVVFFVIDIACVPSQKGIGSEGRVYSLRLAVWSLSVQQRMPV